jgi:uncharacterized protein YceK
MKVYFVAQVLLAFTCIYFLSGCASIIGIKEYQSGDTRISFVTGYDVGAAFNGVDTVDNNRGIKPGAGYVNTATKKGAY